ncbi:hypothetical protein [Paenibacillus lutrae]|uniref:DUF3168 domain-containing protein n=1 Tax=Paenibacillus lutrae TaxID=2078573 RepID=A0A7X3FJM2_9BACL|nr:hypothetical protein [Paenibacillus lutrae]MVP00807.1 hypothetical protein [Paenibacillus lutrae]
MASFKDYNLHIQNVLQMLLSNPYLCKLIAYPDPMQGPDIDDPNKLLFTHLYPIPIKPLPGGDENVYLTVVWDEIKLSKAGYTDRILSFHIFCPLSKWKITDATLRPYSIMNEIQNLFNHTRFPGLGRMLFEHCTLLSVNEAYAGYKMDYRLSEYNG